MTASNPRYGFLAEQAESSATHGPCFHAGCPLNGVLYIRVQVGPTPEDLSLIEFEDRWYCQGHSDEFWKNHGGSK